MTTPDSGTSRSAHTPVGTKAGTMSVKRRLALVAAVVALTLLPAIVMGFLAPLAIGYSQWASRRGESSDADHEVDHALHASA